MLTSTRRFAKSWGAAVIIGLLIVALSMFAFTDVFRGNFSTAVVSAGHREVTQPEFRQIIDGLNRQNQQMTGQQYTMEELVEGGQHLQVLEGLADQEAMLAWLWRVGVRPAHDLVAAQLRQIQQFFDPVTGQFDEQAYAGALAQEGLTPARFEQEVADQIGLAHYRAAVIAGSRVPRVYGALEAAYSQETRSGRWVMLTPDQLGDIPAPTDAQLQTLLNEFADQVREPERRVVTLVRFTPTQAAGRVEVTDAEIQERFEFQRESLGTPERRTFVTLTAPNAQVAADITRRLRAGEDPAAVGQALNIEPVSYNAQPRSAVADTRVAAAVFGLQPGAVSDPVQGELGLVVAKLTGVSPGQAATLEAHREEIEQAIRMAKARVEVTDMVERFVAAREAGASLADAAQQTGGEMITLPPFSAQGLLPNGQPMGAPEVLYETAFATAEGADSDIVDAGEDEYFAIHVDEVTPARMPTVDDLRSELTQAWRSRELGRRMQERANALAARVRGGETLDAVAADEGLTIVRRERVGRGDAEGDNPVAEGVLDGLFGQGRNQVFSGPANREGHFAIGVVDEIRAPTAALAGQAAEARRPEMTNAILQQELVPALQSAAREAVNVSVHPDRARAALGVAPEEEAPAADAAE